MLSALDPSFLPPTSLQNATTSSINTFNENHKGWLSFEKYTFGKIQTTFFTVGVFANILIIVYFSTRHGKRRASINMTRNSEVIKVVIRRKNMTSYNFLLVILAIADLLACCSLLVSHYQQYMWHSSSWYCRFSSLVLEAVSTFSIWSLVLLFYQRYRGIVNHVDKLRKRTYMGISFLLFVCSFLVFAPEIFEVDLAEDNKCVLKTSYNKIEFYTLFFYYRVLDTFLPTALMFFFRLKTSRYVRHVSRNIRSIGAGGSGGLPTNLLRRRLNTRTAIRTINWLFGFYTLTIVPWRLAYTVTMYLTYFHAEFMAIHEQTMDLFNGLVYFMGFSNNFVNIFVYAILIADIRRFLKRVFTCGLYSK